MWILNTLPVRGSYLESYCGASPANDMRPLQGQKRELMSTAAGDRGKPLSWKMSPFQGQQRNYHVIWLKTAQRLFLILNTLACRGKNQRF